MEEQRDLPKPELDLPLPEKEIPAEAGLASKGDAFRSYRKTNIFKNKFFLGFVGLSLLIAFLIGGFALGRNSVFKELNPTAPSIPPPDEPKYQGSPTPTIDETANWKTFTNQKYSYSIKYPENLTVNEQNTYYHYVEFRLPNGADGSVYIAPYLVSVIPETFTASDPAAYNYMASDVINSFFAMKSGEIKKIDTSTFTKLPDTTVGGQTGIAVNVTATGTNQKRVYVKHNGNIYMITDNNNPSANFQKFLSTFKFTN